MPGKSATDCQAKTFEQFRSPPTDRKAAKKAIKRASAEPRTAVPSKIARAGSNKFKKQVREFVEEVRGGSECERCDKTICCSAGLTKLDGVSFVVREEARGRSV